MRGSRPRPLAWLLLGGLAALAAGSLAWGVVKALGDSADLERRVEEVNLFVRGHDPYDDPDMTYPPSAPPVFSALIAPVRARWRRVGWLALNLIALATYCGVVARTWGRDWPPWLRWAYGLAVVASKPVRGGIALGQFHLIPLALITLAMTSRRPAISGFLLGLAMIKPTMVGPLLFVLILRKDWIALAVAMATQAALTLTTTYHLDASPILLFREWFGRAREQIGQGTIDVPTILHRLFPGMAIDGTKISLAILAISLVVLIRARRASILGLASVSLFFAAILTYHRPYDMVLLLPAVAYFLDESIRSGKRSDLLATAGFAALLALPSPPSHLPQLALIHETYEVVYILGSYAALGLLIRGIMRGASPVPNESMAGGTTP